MKGNIRVVFMGTPEFASGILEHLFNEGVDICAVVTVPDKPAGRGQKLSESPVKLFAKSKGMEVLQPVNLKDDSFIARLKDIGADLFVVIAFRMLPEVVWQIPPKGTINLHGSLLPQYRGAAPINWAIINGERETGVTTFFIEKEIDTGAIIGQRSTPIGENETVGDLYKRLLDLGAELTYETIRKIETGDYTAVDQKNTREHELKPAPKIFKEDCKINFNRPVCEVHNFCRGLSPYPAAWTVILDLEKNQEKSFKIFTTRTTEIPVGHAHKLIARPEGILFPCSDYYLLVTELQPEGKRMMTFKEFLAGNALNSLQISPK